MKYVVALVRFWYDFIVGDDWQIAAGIVVALALTFTLAHGDIAAWWIMPLAAAGLLALSLWRVAKKRR